MNERERLASHIVAKDLSFCLHCFALDAFIEWLLLSISVVKGPVLPTLQAQILHH